MDIRYSASPNDVKRYTTEELRKEFLIENLYRPDEVVAVYSHVDRMVTLGCMPVKESVSIDKGIDIWKNFGTKFFLERREIGIFNIGGAGKITVDGTVYELGYKDCLYITMGAKDVKFSSDDAGKPAKFYMVSAPAHRSYETKLLKIADANKKPCGEAATSNKRFINQFIHPAVLKTCQLSMGMTVLESGSVWNTMPAHTHERRMEVYMYFEVPEDQAIIKADLGGVDILMNNAGIIKRIPMTEMSAEDFRQVVDIDLVGPFICAKAVIPGMIEKGHGKIINICSMMSELGRETVSAYAAAKGGLKMLTRNICSEYGEANIQCNGIGPGYIATPQTAPLRERQPDGSRHPFDQFIVAKTPAARWGTPEDLMGPAVFLASDASDFVNGHILYVDGGILAYIGKQP